MSDEPDDECIHGMYPKTSCTICTKKPQDKNDIQYEFTNQYTLGCYECGGTMPPGSTVSVTRDDRKLCEGCI